MKFWDASALVPLLTPEPESEAALSCYRDDPELMVWALTPVEIVSALSRKLREGGVSTLFMHARAELRALSAEWTEISDVDPVRERAYRLLDVHPLRAADALQLAAALVGTGERPVGFPFVTYDRMLAEAARKEGFAVGT